MEKYYIIVKYNFKYCLKYNIIIAIVFSILTKFFWQLNNLNELKIAEVLECYFSLIGIILLPALYSPLSDLKIKDLLKTKMTAIWYIYFVLTSIEMIYMLFLEGAFLIYLKLNMCKFDFMDCYLCVISNSLFLGYLGLLIAIISHNQVIGYMIPILFFTISYFTGGSMFGMFNLFSMINGSIIEKYFLLLTSIIIYMIILVQTSLKSICKNKSTCCR